MGSRFLCLPFWVVMFSFLDTRNRNLLECDRFPEVPPRVEYALSDLGFELGEAFCGVWHWAEANIDKIEEARASYDARR